MQIELDRDVIHHPLSEAAKQAIGIDVATAIGWQVSQSSTVSLQTALY